MYKYICEYFTTYIYSIIGKRFILDLRIRVIKHVESMSGEFFTNTDASEIFTIFDDDIDNIEQLASKMIFFGDFRYLYCHYYV